MYQPNPEVVMNVMPRARDPNRDRAKEMWLDYGGDITNRQIAEQLDIDEKKVAVWKQRDKWNVVQQSGVRVVQQTDSNVVQQKRGAPKGNKNAVGNRGGAPPGNQNAKGNRGGPGGPFKNDHAVTHGFFRKYLPEDTAEIMEQIAQRSPIDMLWDQIMIQYTAIIRAQQIMYVKDRVDVTTTKIEEKFGNVSGERWEVQQAWDKQATFLSAQSRAMSTLQGMIIKYEELCRQNQVDEERELRVKKMKLELAEMSGENDTDPHEQGKSYEDALNAQAAAVFADEVNDHEEA